MSNLGRLPRPLIESYEWQEDGLCGPDHIELFFIPDDVSRVERNRRTNEAKLLCARCPVMKRCRDHALSVEEPFGIWGGLTAYERRQQLQHRKKAA